MVKIKPKSSIDKINLLRRKIKKLRKRKSALEDEQYQYSRFEEIEYEIYHIDDMIEDIMIKIQNLKK
jgi:FtsZ-binding cell division protein ZapB